MMSRQMLLCAYAGPTGKVLLLPEDPNAVIIMVATGTGMPGQVSAIWEAHAFVTSGVAFWMFALALTEGTGMSLHATDP